MTDGIWLVQAIDPAQAASLAQAGLTKVVAAECAGAQEDTTRNTRANGSLGMCPDARSANNEADDVSGNCDVYSSGLDEASWAELSARGRMGCVAAEDEEALVQAVPPDLSGNALGNETDGFTRNNSVPYQGSVRQASSRSMGVCAAQTSSGYSQSTAKAPVITAISGRGGSGKSTIVAAMAEVSSLLGLRTAVLDLDLMFGNLHDMFGFDDMPDMAELLAGAARGSFNEDELLRAAARIGPGLTLWGPIAQAEKAELMGAAVELLIGTLQREADVVFVDTSTFWGDAVAAAVSKSSRCLVLGDHANGSPASAARVIDLVDRLGVPRTCMTSVLNRFGARGCDEEYALRFEMACSLGSKVRIADGGADLKGLLAFGKAETLVGQNTPFARDIREFTRNTLLELGCSPGIWPEAVFAAGRRERSRMRLPWDRKAA